MVPTSLVYGLTYILLFIFQVGDFGLVRLGGTGNNAHTVVKTTTVFGTSAYMALEAFRGDISVKLDTFSFGVV